MRRIRLLMGLGLMAGISLSGCTWTESEVRPKPPPAEFKAPPEDDPRYGNPQEYPKETLTEDSMQKKGGSAMKAGMPGPMSSSGRMGAGGPGGSPGGF